MCQLPGVLTIPWMFAALKDFEMVHGKVTRGIKIIHYSEEDKSEPEFHGERRLKDHLKRHSEFGGFLIELYVEKSKYKEVTELEDEDDEKKDDDKDADEWQSHACLFAEGFRDHPWASFVNLQACLQSHVCSLRRRIPRRSTVRSIAATKSFTI